MNKEVNAVILAGGRGARMGELTNEAQKCMLYVDDKPILAHILDNLVISFGSVDLIIATGYKGETIKQFFGSKYRNIDIKYVHDPRPLETKKRLLLAERLLTQPFLLISGDVIANPEQYSKVATTFYSENHSVLGTISGASNHLPALSHALITQRNRYIAELVFPPNGDGISGQLREMGIAFFDSTFVNVLKGTDKEHIYISKILAELIKQGVDFAAEPYFDKWYHFVNPQDINTTVIFNRPSEAL